MKRNMWGVAALILLAGLTGVLLCGGLYAKYIRSETLHANITFSVKLASEFRLTEHQAIRQADGSYQLGSTEVIANVYQVMPGVDIPKDPQVIIQAKSMVSAYLYIEVLASCPDTVSYTLTSDWKALPGITGANGGAVYVYAKDGAAAVLDGKITDYNIPILKDNQLMVSERYQDTGTFAIKFWGYMAQIADGSDAAQLFRDQFLSAGGEES